MECEYQMKQLNQPTGKAIKTTHIPIYKKNNNQLFPVSSEIVTMGPEDRFQLQSHLIPNEGVLKPWLIS